MAACKTKHRGMFVVGDPRSNSGKALVNKRGPITTALQPVRTLFEFMDANHVPYRGLPNREAMERYRTGKRGLSLYTLIEWADALDFDIVVVPRGQVATPATQQPAVATPSAVGTGGGGAASPLPLHAAAGL